MRPTVWVVTVSKKEATDRTLPSSSSRPPTFSARRLEPNRKWTFGRPSSGDWLAFSPMHGWWDKLSVEAIRAVTAYIRRLAPCEPSSP